MAFIFVNSVSSIHISYYVLQTAALYSISPWSLALKRLPALGVTLALELCGGIVISQLHQVGHDVHRHHHLIDHHLGYQGLHSDSELHASYLCNIW